MTSNNYNSGTQSAVLSAKDNRELSQSMCVTLLYNHNDNDNDLSIILAGIHSKYTVFDMLHSRYYPALQDLSVSLNTVH